MKHFPIYTDPTPSCLGDEPITTPSAPALHQHHQPLSHYTQSNPKLHLKPAVVGSNIKNQVFVDSENKKFNKGRKQKNYTSRTYKEDKYSFENKTSKNSNAVSFIQENSYNKSNKTGQKCSIAQQHAMLSINEIDVPKPAPTQIKQEANNKRSSSSKNVKALFGLNQQKMTTEQKLSKSFISQPTSSKISTSSTTPRPQYQSTKPLKIKHEPLNLSEQLNASLVSDIGLQIANYLKSEDPRTLALGSLQKHDIVEDLRCKMVDWMVQVLTNFKSQDQTLFLAVSLLDRYFSTSDIKCTVVDLHLTGIISMFAASKLEDPLPLTLDLAQNNIGHKRFTCQELRIAEMKILSTLGWRLQTPTIYQNILIILELIMPLTNSSSQQAGAVSVEYKQARMKLQKYAVYLGMLTLHDYQLITKTQSSIIARACLILAFRILILKKGKNNEYEKQKTLQNFGLVNQEQFYYQIKMFGLQDGIEKYNEYKIKQNKAIQRLEELYFNFEGMFKGVNNLRKLCEDVKPHNIGVKRIEIQQLMSQSILDEKLAETSASSSRRYGIR